MKGAFEMKKIKIILLFAASLFVFSQMAFAGGTLYRGDKVGKGSLDIEHNLTVRGNSSVEGNQTVAGNQTITGTLTNSRTRTFDVPLAGLMINGTGPMGADGTTAPGLATTDGIPKVVYASSAEAASIGYTFMVPSDYSTGLLFRAMLSSSAATPASMSIGWELYVNKNAVAFDAASYSQTAVSPTTNITATNEYLTFTADATALSGITAGDSVTVWWWNADTRVSGTTEIGAVQGRYTSTM